MTCVAWGSGEMKGRKPTPIGKQESESRLRLSAAEDNWADSLSISLTEPMKPRPPARVTAVARRGPAKPPMGALIRIGPWGDRCGYQERRREDGEGVVVPFCMVRDRRSS